MGSIKKNQNWKRSLIEVLAKIRCRLSFTNGKHHFLINFYLYNKINKTKTMKIK